MRLVTIHQPETLPWLGFIDKLRQCDLFVLLDHVQFEKNYFQNRNRIRTPCAEGWSWLTVPVLLKGRFGQAIQEVQINNAVDWRNQHLSSLRQHYHRAPYYELYYPILRQQYARDWHYLVDFNIQMILLIAEALGVRKTIVRSSDLHVPGKRSELLVAICQSVQASEYLSGISGMEYLDARLFREADVVVKYQQFFHPVYQQCYRPFVPGMSSLDLLFNHGPQSLSLLEDETTPRLARIFE